MKNPSYSNACGNNASVEVLFPKTSKNNTIIITEGHFKARKLADIGYISMSIQGVTHWKKVKEVLNTITKKHKIDKYYIAFDADSTTNDAVSNCLVQLAKDLLQFDNVFILVWNKKYGNGIDDLMENTNYSKYISCVSIQEFIYQKRQY